MSKSRATLWISRLLRHHHQPPRPLAPIRHRLPISASTLPHSHSHSHAFSSYSGRSSGGVDDPEYCLKAIRSLIDEVEREKSREREERRKAGIDVDEEEEEDYMGVEPLIQKLDKEISPHPAWGEPTDSDSEVDDMDEAEKAEIKKMEQQYEKKCKRHGAMIDQLVKSETLDDAHKWMEKIDKFEEKHFKLRPEYRVIGEMMNRFKVATGKEKFLLAQKLNRALRLVERIEAFDPNDPANYGVIQMDQMGSEEVFQNLGIEREKRMIKDGVEEEEEFDDMKERDNILIEKLNEIDKQLENKLTELEYTFGKKGKRLEEEIRDLAEERNSLQEKKRRPLYRKNFDVQLIDVNRTCKVTKGGQVIKYTAILVCGNYNGVVGFAKARGPAVPVAIQKAYEKCFQNLHTVDRYEDHTIAHAVQTAYKKTKIYLWPASTTIGVKAGPTVKMILNLAGFKNVKSKVVGSRNKYNTVKAVFKALNSIESPKDVQEKFGRTVVESHLL